MADKFMFIDSNGDYDLESFISVSTGSADAGKAIKTNVSGLVDASFIDFSTVSLLDGSQDYTDIVSYVSSIAVSAFTDSSMIVNKAYVDAVAKGMSPHGEVKAASVDILDNNSTISSGSVSYDNNLTITATLVNSGVFIDDGYTFSNNDRYLVKNEDDTGGLGGIANGIYVVNISGTSLTLTRSEDQDNSPDAEVVNGVLIPNVLNGTVNHDHSFIISSSGTGTNGAHVFGTDAILFSSFPTVQTLTAGDGITIVSDQVNIDWATVYTIDSADAKAVKLSVLASTTSGEGASIIGINDAAGYFTSNNVEGALVEVYELASSAATGYRTYTAGGNITQGDLVYIASNNSVVTFSDVTTSEYPIGISTATVSSGSSVNIAMPGSDVTISGGSYTAGTKYFWNGSGFETSWSALSNGSHIWVAGIGVDSDTMHVVIDRVGRAR